MFPFLIGTKNYTRIGVHFIKKLKLCTHIEHQIRFRLNKYFTSTRYTRQAQLVGRLQYLLYSLKNFQYFFIRIEK